MRIKYNDYLKGNALKTLVDPVVNKYVDAINSPLECIDYIKFFLPYAHMLEFDLFPGIEIGLNNNKIINLNFELIEYELFELKKALANCTVYIGDITDITICFNKKDIKVSYYKKQGNLYSYGYKYFGPF